MDAHPLQLRVEPASQMDRMQVVIRLLLLVALGVLGCSSAYWFLYLVLPTLVAMRISQTSAQRYLTDDGPRIARVLGWLAEAYAYLWLLTDALPSGARPLNAPQRAVDLDVTPVGAPTPSTVLLRLVTSLPALLMLGLLSLAAGLLWPIGAIWILARRRLPGVLVDFFLMTLRGQFRLIAYHLSLVDRYPTFDDSLTGRDVPHSGPV
jgi:hypothetical protein